METYGKGCRYQNAENGCCNHDENSTPECHAEACPLTVKCKNCSYFEQWAEAGEQEFYNKCALLDVWNLKADEFFTCEYYEAGEPEMNIESIPAGFNKLIGAAA